MGNSTQKAQSRARILDEAAKAMRVSGAEGIGVAELMKRAGLTHGGFYAHFDNRDDLVAHAVDRMFDDSRTMLDRHFGQNDAAKGLTALIDYYLSKEARDAAERGCPLPSLSGEAARLPPPARLRFGEGVKAFLTVLQTVLHAAGHPDAQSLGMSVFAEMVGAVTLARAADQETGEHILAASRAALKQRLGLERAN